MGILSTIMDTKRKIDRTRRLIDLAREDRNTRRAGELARQLDLQKNALENAKLRSKLEETREKKKKLERATTIKKYKGSALYKGMSYLAKKQKSRKSPRKATRKSTKKSSKRP